MRELPEKVGSKYKFITLAAKRCEMLQKGAKPKVDADQYLKYTSVAMDEILSGLIDFVDSEEQQADMKERAEQAEKTEAGD